MSQYNQIYEFPYQLQGVQSQMVFTSVTGHLMGIDFVERSWNKLRPVDLFTAPIVKTVPAVRSVERAVMLLSLTITLTILCGHRRIRKT